VTTPSGVEGSGRWQVLLALLLGLAAVSHAAVLIRLAEAHPVVIAAFRLATASLVVVPLAMLRCRQEWSTLSRQGFCLALGAGALLALHFASWIASLAYTSIANSVVLVSLTPVWIALATVVFLGRRVALLTLGSVALSVLGSAIIGIYSAEDDARGLLGDGLALAGGIFMAGYLMLGQQVRRELSLLAYIALCYGTAAVLLGLAVVMLNLPVMGLGAGTYLAMLALGLVSQVIGHSVYNWVLKRFSPNFVSVCLLGEPVLSGLLGLLYFREAIANPTLIGGGIVLLGIYLGIQAEVAPTKKPPEFSQGV